MPTGPSPAVLRDLIARVRDATGPDRELDAHILCALLAPASAFVEQSRFNGAWCVLVPSMREGRPANLWETPSPFRQGHTRFTESLDATLALVERELPGWKWTLGIERNASFPDDAAHAAVMDRDWPDPLAGDGLWFDGHAEMPALAILAALLSAKLALLTQDAPDAE